MPEKVTFYSDGIQLVGYVYRPDDASPGEDRSGILVCHGFGAHQERYLPDIAIRLAKHGYVAMTFDYRGFGESDGPKWRLIPSEQVIDIRNALTFLQCQNGVDKNRVGLYGTSYGGANVVNAAAVDKRVKCTVSVVGVGNGERWMRGLRRSYEWTQLNQDLEDDWKQRVLTGQSKMVDRLDLMLTDPDTRSETEKIYKQYPASATHLPLETGQAVIDNHPEKVAYRISPRPILFIVAENDVLVPPELTLEVYDAALEPKRWVVIPSVGHFEVYYDPALAQVISETNDWFQLHMPARS